MRNNEQKSKEELSISFPDIQFSQNDCGAIKIKKNVDLQIYLHIERMLPKQKYHYSEKSQFFEKYVRRQKIVNETIKYIDSFKENIKPFLPQHNQQISFVLNITKNNNELITNRYFMHPVKDSTNPAKFQLSFGWMNSKINFKQFFSFDKWDHLVELSFNSCGWFNNDDWRALVERAGNFKNLQDLWLASNKINLIKEGDIEQFKSLDYINLMANPLNRQSREVLERLKQTNNRISIEYFK